MNTSFCKWPIIALLAWGIGGVAAVCADENADIDLQEITRRLTQWRASFVNVRVEWELRSLPETDTAFADWPPPPDADAGSSFSREEWIWADHGLDLLEERDFFYPDGGSRVHSIEAFNGPKGVVYRAQYRRLSEDKPEQFSDLLLAGMETGKPTSRKVRTPVNFLYWASHAAWLPELLTKWKWEFDAIETVGEDLCARIVPADPEKSASVGALWVDLNHDCLVRRQRRLEVRGQILGGDFIVDEYQQLEGGIWFPKRGRTQLGGTPHENHLFVVTEAEINQSLDLARFDPPVPAIGTAVEDHGRSYVHGAAARQLVEQQATLNRADVSKPRAISATPPTSNWLWWSAALASTAVLFLATGFWLSNLKKENQS